MEFRPFGREVNGERIQDVSGLTVLANLEYLQHVVLTHNGKEAADRVIEDLVQSLNECIPDGTYHVTPDFLKNPWNSYSYEFVMFLNEFCVRLSGDPNFHCNLGRHKVLSPIVQALGRPFSITQIYKLWPYFAEKFTKGALLPQIVTVTNGRAVMRLQFSERTSRQFGVYFRGCAERICQTVKSAIAEVPALMFGLQSASVQDRCCMSEGAEYCEWIFTWQPHKSQWTIWNLSGLLLGIVLVVVLWTWVPELSHLQALGMAILPAVIIWFGRTLWKNRREIQEKGKIIQEQLQAAETRHEELREAYLTQEQITLDLRQRVAELTMLHQMGFCLGSTLDRDALIEIGFQAIIKELRYDRAMIVFYDEDRALAHNVRAVGLSKDLANRVRDTTMPISGEDRIESRILKQGMSVFIEDIHEALPCLHPLLQQVVATLGTKTFVAVPLKVQNRILGAVVADRLEPNSLTSQDMSVLSTLANQLAMALDNAKAYAEIEQLNIGLESKVQERTAELQQINVELQTANERLKELDQLKSQFLSYCSHELRTPLTAIKGFAECMFQDTHERMSERQQLCLTRINANTDRLTRMIADLLDLARIESGTIHMGQIRVDLTELLQEVLEQLQIMARPKGQNLQLTCPPDTFTIVGDHDRLQQIVTNLIHNALKFTPEKGTVSVELCRNSLTTIMLVVSDTGPGIPAHVLSNLFEPFFQVHREVDRENRGLGLGLTIVKNLVGLHGGSITVESQLGKGTTFRVSLPREPISILDSQHPRL
jgi:signal transduction histidine kinase